MERETYNILIQNRMKVSNNVKPKLIIQHNIYNNNNKLLFYIQRRFYHTKRHGMHFL